MQVMCPVVSLIFLQVFSNEFAYTLFITWMLMPLFMEDNNSSIKTIQTNAAK